MLDLNASRGARWVEIALMGAALVMLASLILA
jgi:hypothetical protein